MLSGMIQGLLQVGLSKPGLRKRNAQINHPRAGIDAIKNCRGEFVRRRAGHLSGHGFPEDRTHK
jgi:hypothetical protein